MAIDRSIAIQLCSFGGLVGIAAAGHHFGGEQLVGILPLAFSLAREGATILAAHMGTHLIVHAADSSAENAAQRARVVENHDLHRLIGKAAAVVLDRAAAAAPGGADGQRYLENAAKAFRERWITFEPGASETALEDASISQYFIGGPDTITNAPVLTTAEWIRLIQAVAGGAPSVGLLALTPDPRVLDALQYAAGQLRDHFASELWEAAKHAWSEDDNAWPALILRLLGEVLDNARRTATNGAQLDKSVSDLAARAEMLATRIDTALSEMRSAPTETDALMRIVAQEYRADIATLATTLNTLVVGQQQIANDLAGMSVLVASTQTNAAAGATYAQVAAANSETLLQKVDALAAAHDIQAVLDEGDYLDRIEESLPDDIATQLAHLRLRAPTISGHPTLSICELGKRHGQFVILTDDPTGTALLLSGLPRHADTLGWLDSGTLPVRIPIARWPPHQALEEFIAVVVAHTVHEADSFLPFVKTRLDARQLFLIAEPPASADIPPEVVSRLAEELAKESGLKNSVAVVARFGQDVTALQRAGYPLVVRPSTGDKIPSLELTLHVAITETRDPVGEIAGHKKAYCRIGQSWHVTCQANVDCYLALFCRGTTGRIYQLFLEPERSTTFAHGGGVYNIPRSGDAFRIREGGPAGTEVIRAFATREPLSIHVTPSTPRGYFSPSSEEQFERAVKEVDALPASDCASEECKIVVTER